MKTWECWRADAGGVSCYSSKNLVDWKFEGIVLPTSADPKSDLHSSQVIERPKVIFNERTKKFVMDLIFPLFLFIAGLSFPFSLDKKREKQESNRQIIGDLVKRTLKLIALGLVYNGFLKLNFPNVRFASVLAHIGLAWFFAGLVYVYSEKLSTLAVWVVSILVGYGALNLLVLSPEAVGGNPFLPENNIVCQFDRWFLPGVLYNGNFDPEGFLSVIPAIATALAGMARWHHYRALSRHRQRW